MAIEVTRSVVEALLVEAARAHPLECCGLLLGEPDRILRLQPARNVAEEPARRFAIDPQALIDAHRTEREGGPILVGYYHSHPTGLAAPSATDRAEASGDGRVWAIVAAGAVGWWRDARDGFAPLPLAMVDG